MTSVPCKAWVMSTEASGYLLHQIPYRETSSLVDVFTLTHGRHRLLARGLRKPGPTPLHPFTPLQLAWSGRGSLPVLTRVEAAGTPLTLTATALYCGLYLNELLIRLLPQEDPCPAVYAGYHQTLTRLTQKDCPEAPLRYFELLLLESLGYGLRLDRSAVGCPVQADRHYHYRIDYGLEEVPAPTADSLSGSTLSALQNHTLSDEIQLRQAKRLMRRSIHHYTQGKPLGSRALFQTRTITSPPA